MSKVSTCFTSFQIGEKTDSFSLALKSLCQYHNNPDNIHQNSDYLTPYNISKGNLQITHPRQHLIKLLLQIYLPIEIRNNLDNLDLLLVPLDVLPGLAYICISPAFRTIS